MTRSGFLGLFTGGFTACAAGVSAALIFGYLASSDLQFQNAESNQNRFSVNSKRRTCQYTLSRVTCQVSHAFDLQGYGYRYVHKSNRGNEGNVEHFCQTGIEQGKMNQINDIKMNMLDNRSLIVADRISMIHCH